MFKFDFQLFAELDIPGISEETLKELEAESQDAQETTEEDVEPAEVDKPEELHVDADNVNKQVEEKDEFDDVKDGQTIPYDRFKSVNERRKTAESRIKELEEQLAKAQQNVAKPAPVEAGNVEQSPKAQQLQEETPNGEYTDEQEERMYQIAIQRVAKKRNMSDEDVEAMEYTDGVKKLNWQNALTKEIDLIKREVVEFKAQEKAFNDMTAACADEFETLNQKFNGYQDAQERWNYISQERFSKLSQRKQSVLKEAFTRLQAKKGTYADMEMVKDYLDLANNEWDKSHSVSNSNASAKPVSDKYAQVQKLPKSGNISGSSGGADDFMNAERLADILNEPDGWDKLSPEQQQRILSGRF